MCFKHWGRIGEPGLRKARKGGSCHVTKKENPASGEVKGEGGEARPKKRARGKKRKNLPY